MANSSDFLPENVLSGLSRPAPGVRWVLVTLLAFLLIVVALVCFGRLDRTAVAHGRLIPTGHSRIVQAPMGGVVAHVRVSEGARVRQGEELVVLSAQVPASGLDGATAQYEMSKLELSRVEAQIAGSKWIPPGGVAAGVVAKVAARYQAERDAQMLLESQERHALRRLREDHSAAAASVIELEELTKRHKAEEAAMASLIAKGHVSRLQVLAKERERISSQQQLAAARHRLAGASDAVSQQQSRVDGVRADYVRRLEAERMALLRDVQQQATALVEARRAMESTRLVAPVDGVVVDLMAAGEGRVLQPGEAVLTIVPDDRSLQAEVWLENADASQVREGQVVRLKVMAIDYRRFGVIDGEVVHVAADATLAPAASTATGATMPDPSLPSYAFKATILPGQRVSGRSFGSTLLRPGMRVTAEIVIGRRTVLDYLLSPVARTIDEAGEES